MRLNTISRQMNEMIEKINSIKKIQSLPLIDQINSFICKIKDIQKQNFIVSFRKIGNWGVSYVRNIFRIFISLMVTCLMLVKIRGVKKN